MSELTAFDTRLAGLIEALSPQSRKAMAATIAKRLRKHQQQRKSINIVDNSFLLDKNLFISEGRAFRKWEIRTKVRKNRIIKNINISNL